MVDEPNNRIVALLKAYAKKRRGQAGAPFELHPATRRLLQAEVAKLGQPAAAKPHSWWAAWLTLPRVAFAVSVLCVLAIGMFVLVEPRRPTESEVAATGKPSSGEDRAATAERTARPAELKTTKEPGPVGRTVVADHQRAVADNDRQELAAKGGAGGELVSSGGARADALPSQAPAAIPPAPEMSRTPATVAAPTLAGKRPVAGSQLMDARQAQNVPSQRFSRANQARAGHADAKAQSLDNVLRNFEVEEVGDELRIVDADGSTYSGPITATEPAVAPAAASDAEARVSRATASRAQSAPARLAPAPATALPAPVQAAQFQNYSFRATGTNRSLNQLVVFSGKVVAQTNSVQSGAPLPQGAVQQNQMPPGAVNARIEGRARVGDLEIQIEAVPAAP